MRATIFEEHMSPDAKLLRQYGAKRKLGEIMPRPMKQNKVELAGPVSSRVMESDIDAVRKYLAPAQHLLLSDKRLEESKLLNKSPLFKKADWLKPKIMRVVNGKLERVTVDARPADPDLPPPPLTDDPNDMTDDELRELILDPLVDELLKKEAINILNKRSEEEKEEKEIDEIIEKFSIGQKEIDTKKLSVAKDELEVNTIWLESVQARIDLYTDLLKRVQTKKVRQLIEEAVLGVKENIEDLIQERKELRARRLAGKALYEELETLKALTPMLPITAKRKKERKVSADQPKKYKKLVESFNPQAPVAFYKEIASMFNEAKGEIQRDPEALEEIPWMITSIQQVLKAPHKLNPEARRTLMNAGITMRDFYKKYAKGAKPDLPKPTEIDVGSLSLPDIEPATGPPTPPPPQFGTPYGRSEIPSPFASGSAKKKKTPSGSAKKKKKSIFDE